MTIEIVALLAGAAVFFAVYAIMAPVNDLSFGGEDEFTASNGGWRVTVTAPAGDSAFEKYVRPAVRNFLPQAPMAVVLHARRDQKAAELLVRSGNPWNILPEELFGIRVLGAAAAFVGAVALTAIGALPPLLGSTALWLPLMGYLGWWYPGSRLKAARGKRIKSARKGLPEALDLLIITLNSGMNFAPALAEVVERLPEGIIEVELRRVLADLQAGRRLDAALADLARRAPSDEVESFCKAIVVSERLGSDVSETLRNQADAARQAYEAHLDVRIGKLSTTLYFPILCFMLPALFLAILAPAFSSIAAAF